MFASINMLIARTLSLCIIFIIFSPIIASADESIGIRIRRELDDQNLALVDWHRGSDSKGDYYVEYVTAPKKSFADAVPWDGSNPPQLPIERLVQLASKIAANKSKDFSFEGLMINPCEDDPSKRFVTVWFQDSASPDWDDIMVHLLLSGSPTTTTRRPVTAEEYSDLEKHGIPKLGEQDGADQPATAPELKSDGKEKPIPESEVRPQ